MLSYGAVTSGDGDPDGTLTFSLVRNSTEILSGVLEITKPKSELLAIPHSFRDSPAAGTYTYYLKARWQSSTVWYGQVFARSISAMEVKK